MDLSQRFSCACSLHFEDFPIDCTTPVLSFLRNFKGRESKYSCSDIRWHLKHLQIRPAWNPPTPTTTTHTAALRGTTNKTYDPLYWKRRAVKASIYSLKLGVGQNIASCASSAGGMSAFLISALPVHFSQSSSINIKRNMYHDKRNRLLMTIWWSVFHPSFDLRGWLGSGRDNLQKSDESYP